MTGEQFESAINQAAQEQAATHKPWWLSRTIWFNLVALALAMAEANLGLLNGHLPGNVYAWAAFGLPVVNMALRVITKAGVRL
jgi:hypothetical protein